MMLTVRMATLPFGGRGGGEVGRGERGDKQAGAQGGGEVGRLQARSLCVCVCTWAEAALSQKNQGFSTSLLQLKHILTAGAAKCNKEPVKKKREKREKRLLQHLSLSMSL